MITSEESITNPEIPVWDKDYGISQESINEANEDARRFRSIANTAILELGRILIKQKALLPHGSFGSWCLEELQLSQQKASELMRASIIIEKLPEFSPHLRSAREIVKLADATEEQRQRLLEAAGRGVKLTRRVIDAELGRAPSEATTGAAAVALAKTLVHVARLVETYPDALVRQAFQLIELHDPSLVDDSVDLLYNDPVVAAAAQMPDADIVLEELALPVGTNVLDAEHALVGMTMAKAKVLAMAAILGLSTKRLLAQCKFIVTPEVARSVCRTADANRRLVEPPEVEDPLSAAWLTKWFTAYNDDVLPLAEHIACQGLGLG